MRHVTEGACHSLGLRESVPPDSATCYLEMPKGAERHIQPGGPTLLDVP